MQEFIPARGRYITRVETLGGRFLYAIKVSTTGESFNLCPAEICQVEREAEQQKGDEQEGVPQDFELCLVDAPKKGLVVDA